jgi:hypothetical protein
MGKINPVVEIENRLVTDFEHAEEVFDDLMIQVIAELDKAPAPSGGGGSPKSMEEILAMLENEMKAAEKLGIPCRPVNVSIMKDWMKPSEGQAPGKGQGEGKAGLAQAQARAEQAIKEAKKLQRQANKRAKEFAASRTSDGNATGPAAPEISWNKLVSQLEKDLLQGRDSTPPEQYRQAINQYFRTIAEEIPSKKN